MTKGLENPLKRLRSLKETYKTAPLKEKDTLSASSKKAPLPGRKSVTSSSTIINQPQTFGQTIVASGGFNQDYSAVDGNFFFCIKKRFLISNF